MLFTESDKVSKARNQSYKAWNSHANTSCQSFWERLHSGTFASHEQRPKAIVVMVEFLAKQVRMMKLATKLFFNNERLISGKVRSIKSDGGHYSGKGG